MRTLGLLLAVWMMCKPPRVLAGQTLITIELVGDPEKNFVLIMKDGTIYKNTIAPELDARNGGAPCAQ